LGLLDDASEPAAAELRVALSFRLKLVLAAGFAPELASCARCGEAEHLTGFSGADGGVVCASCEGGSFGLTEDAHRFMVEALASPLAEAPQGEELTLRQVERAVGETLEHHAHVRLRPAA
ncbi:MAG TPA: DNA repair protein RecO C-terminal domain-containing protein, partial [Solirubrobacterales bacterium]|nr:DNA repair protein RecO C-terminal domain-containing protein [Solirubrobacterales bacterium]